MLGLFSQILLTVIPQAYWSVWKSFPQGSAQLPICLQPSKLGDPLGQAQINGTLDKSHVQLPKMWLQKRELVQIPAFSLKQAICPSMSLTYLQFDQWSRGWSTGHQQLGFLFYSKYSQSLSQYCSSTAKTIASIWILALFPLQGRKNSSVRSPALCEQMAESLTVSRSRSPPSRLNALMLENSQPAALRQVKVDCRVTGGAVSIPISEKAVAMRAKITNPCRNIDFIKFINFYKIIKVKIFALQHLIKFNEITVICMSFAPDWICPFSTCFLFDGSQSQNLTFLASKTQSLFQN